MGDHDQAGYYAGAFAAALATSAISAADAMVFLAGTNAGAGAYEYALARGTRALLREHPADASHPPDAMG